MREYFDRYGPMVYRRALVLLGNTAEAEDATQEVFVRALKHVDKFRQESSVSTWLYRITTNYCLNQVRNRTTRRRLLEGHTKDQMLALPGAPEPANLIAIRRLLAEADERQARAAVYVYVDGMKREEVANVLSCSVRTVGNLLERFKEWAKKRLGDEAPVISTTKNCRNPSLECLGEETSG